MIKVVAENYPADPRGVIMEHVLIGQRLIKAKSLRRSMNGERGKKSAFRIGYWNRNGHHRLMEFLTVKAESLAAYVIQLTSKPLDTDMSVRCQSFKLKTRQESTAARTWQACHVNFTTGCTVKGHMRADRKCHPKRPVGLDPVNIAHAAWLRPDEIDRLPRCFGNLPQQLVATSAAGCSIRKPKRKQIGSSPGRKPPIMFFKDAGFNQRLTEAVDRLFWPPKSLRQFGWR